MNDPERQFMDAVNDPKAHAPPGYKFEPQPIAPGPAVLHEDDVVYPVLPGGVLHYRPPAEDRRQLRVSVDAVLGFLSCLLVTAALNFFAGFVISRDTNANGAALRAALVCLAPLALFGSLGLRLRARGVWRAFLPAALSGWAVATLIEGVCFVRLVRAGL